MLRTEVPIFYRTFFCRIRRRRMVVTVTSLRAILAGYLMQAVFRNLGEGPAKRWAVKNAENRSPHLLPPIFLPDQTSADGCAGNRPESDLARYLMQEVFRNVAEGPAKRWAVKNTEDRGPHLLPPIFLPDQASANGCDGSRPESDLGRIFDAGGLQERGGRAGKKMGGKKC